MGHRHWIVASGGALAALLVGAGAAVAHVDPVPAEVQAGVPVTVEFGVEHGCDDADTTGMRFEVPAGLTDLEPVAKDGWTTSVDDGVVAFTGGVLDHDTADSFALSFTAPSAAGPIDFPVVQQCGETELRWIEIPQDGAAEPEYPAPRVNVVGEAPPVDTTSAPVATVPAAPSTTVPATTVPSTTAATDAPATSSPAEASTTSVELVIAPAPEATADGAAEGDDGDDGSSSTGWVIAGIVGVAAAAGGGYLYWSRSRSTP